MLKLIVEPDSLTVQHPTLVEPGDEGRVVCDRRGEGRADYRARWDWATPPGDLPAPPRPPTVPALRSAFLPDAPASDDRLRGHSAVARALADTLGGRGSGLVRLVGPFGSGKSTVVELARAAVPETSRVVVYDAWTHHADALRRTVLAAVLAALDPDRTLVPGLHQHVGPPRTETETTTTTGPSPWGLWVGLLAVVVPLLAVFVAPAAGNLAVYGSEDGLVLRSVDHHPYVATVLALVALGGAALWAARRSRDGNDPATLVVQQVDTTVTETVTHGDLDADAFEAHLAAVVRAWTGRADGRTVALVLDDLDRFPDPDRDTAYALLRSLHHVAHGSAAPDGFWVVVPDRPPPPGSVGPDGVLALPPPERDWTDKLYLAQFTVPPALAGATADHLEGLLRRAFPDHPDDELHASARQWLWAGRSAVPRRSVRFVNDLVALYRQHGDDPVPLRVQAAYLARDRTVTVGESERYRLETSLGVDDWVRLAAALHYGLPPDDALEALVADQALDAVGRGDREVVEGALASHPGATLRVLDRHIHTLATGRVPHLLDNAAWVLGAAADGPVARRAWRVLVREAHAVERWDEVSPKGAAGRGLGLILARAHDRGGSLLDLWRAIVRPLVEPRTPGHVEPPPDTPAAPAPDDVAAWAEVTVRALRQALHVGLPAAALDGLRVPGLPETYVAAVRAVGDDPVVRHLRPEDEGVVTRLADPVRHRGPVGDLADSVHALLRVDHPWDWAPLLAAIADRLRNDTGSNRLVGHSLSLGDAHQLLTTLLWLANHPGSTVRDLATQVFGDLDATGALLDAVAHAKPPSDPSDPDLPGALTRTWTAALVAVLYGRSGIDAPADPTSRASAVRDAALAIVRGADRTALAGLVARFHAGPALDAALGAEPTVISDAASAIRAAADPTAPYAAP